MAKTPFTKGKNSAREGVNGAGGMFSQGTGGFTSRGDMPPAGNTRGSTSKANNRTGTFKKRLHGAGGTKGYPK